MTEYRPVRPQDRGEYRRFTQYAFAAEQGPVGDDTGAPESDLFDLRGVYDSGLKSGCKRYTFEAQLREGTGQVGGLGALATPPEHRGQGYARDLCRGVCREYGDEEVGLVALWPFSTPFYQGMGWATTNEFYDVAVSPSVLPRHGLAGECRRLDSGDWRRLRQVEAGFGDGVVLSMRRSETWWRERTLTNWTGGTEPFVYGYERGGDIAGYLVYTVTDEGSHERTLSVSALGYVDEEAHRSLLEFLRRHGAQIHNIELRRSTDTRPLVLAEDPDEVTCERVPGPMARLTGLSPLGSLDWGVLDRPLSLAVEDPLLPEVAGRVRLSADGITRVGDGADGEPDLRVDIATLTQLYLGRFDPATAERLTGLRVLEDSRRESLAAVFPERRVCLREFF